MKSTVVSAMKECSLIIIICMGMSQVCHVMQVAAATRAGMLIKNVQVWSEPFDMKV